MDRWMNGERKRLVAVFFACVQKFAAGWECRPLSLPLSVSPPLRPSIHPSLSVRVYNNGVKHLRLAGNYGWAKTAGSAAPTSFSTPQLALHLHLPSLRHSPDDQRIISVKRPRRQRRVERGKKTDDWSQRDTSGGRYGHSHHQNCPHFGFLCIVFAINFRESYFSVL